MTQEDSVYHKANSERKIKTGENLFAAAQTEKVFNEGNMAVLKDFLQ
jgi:hypothetical protein